MAIRLKDKGLKMTTVDIPVSRARVAEMLALGYELVILPNDPDDPVIMRGPDPDDFGCWVHLSALVVEAADA